MAARQLQRRLSSAIFQHQAHFPLPKDRFVSTINALFSLNRGIRAPPEIPKNPNPNEVSTVKEEGSEGVKYSALSNLKSSTRHDMAMVFTCKVCETRMVKTVCRESYEKGVVVVKCCGCNNMHLIADRLGWFGEPGSVEELLAARGEEVKKGCVDSLNLTPEDLAGFGVKV